MTYANNLDPDEAPQNVGLHLRSKLFDIQIIYQEKKWVETMNFFFNFERNKYLKKLPSMQRVKEQGQIRCPKNVTTSLFSIQTLWCDHPLKLSSQDFK